ncbi:N-6 DNA methylase [Leucobacter sp. OH2974_COT-288]|nr:N-6 DNA methylase [Leucobacter sp. OH2974_COT-288]
MTAGRVSVSTTKDWGTPRNIVEAVRNAFDGDIELDPCSNEWSIVGARREFRLPLVDGLEADWDAKTIYVNPPYGSDPIRGTRIIHWFKKIDLAYKAGSEVITLVPVATNTKHWKEFVYPSATAICFLYEPRVKFLIQGVADKKGAPMSCALIYYGANLERFASAVRHLGAVIPLEKVSLPIDQEELF